MRLHPNNLLSSVFVLGLNLIGTFAFAAQPEYNTILTFKNGQQIGVRNVYSAELRNAAVALTSAFNDQPPTYARLLSVAESMSAKDRCFNLFSSRIALSSVESGRLDASANAENFLKNSISTIDDVNSRTQVTCKMK